MGYHCFQVGCVKYDLFNTKTFIQNCIYEFSYKFETVSYRFLKKGTSYRGFIFIIQRLRQRKVYWKRNNLNCSSLKQVKGEQVTERADAKFSAPRTNWSWVSGTGLRATFIKFLLRSNSERRRNFSINIFPSRVESLERWFTCCIPPFIFPLQSI